MRLTGFWLLCVQLSVLALSAATLGLIVGRYLVPRRGTDPAEPRPAAAAATAGTGPEDGDPTDSSQMDLEPALASLEQRLLTSESEVEELHRALAQVADRKDAEIGRLESGAIRALDTVMESHQHHMAALQRQLDAATARLRAFEQVVEAEQLRKPRPRQELATQGALDPLT